MNKDEFEGYVTRQVGYSEADWENIFQSIRNGAKFGFTYYTALVNEGFNPEQALSIVKAHGVIPKYPPMSPPSREEKED